MDHHTRHTTYGASLHRELGAMADAITRVAARLPTYLRHVIGVWFVLNATVHTHLLLRIARRPLHKTTATSLVPQALMLWKALRSLPPYVQLHILKQESHRHLYGNGKADIQAVHQRTTHLPALQDADLDRNNTHLQHLDPQAGTPSDPGLGTTRRPLCLTRQSLLLPQRHPTPRPSTQQNGQPSTHPRAPGDAESPPLPRSAPPTVGPSPPAKAAHPAPQGATTIPHLARWLARKHNHIAEEHGRCPCDHTTPDDWKHVKTCSLHEGRDTLVGWSPAETLQQH